LLSGLVQNLGCRTDSEWREPLQPVQLLVLRLVVLFRLAVQALRLEW